MTPAKPERQFCVSCGFPLRGSRCEMCGGDQVALQLGEGETRDPRPALAGDDAEGLDRAFEALRANDLPRFVGHVVMAEGGAGTRSVTAPEGPGWIAAIRGALVFTSINTLSGALVLQAPVVRVSRTHRVPLLRLALELSSQELPTARFCLRDDLLLLRFGARLASLTPPVLRGLLREIGHLAARSAELLALSFDAKPVLTAAQRAAGFEVLGRVRKLRLGSGLMRSIPPAAPEPAPPSSRGDSVKTTPLRAVPRNAPLPREDDDASLPRAPLPAASFLARAPLPAPPSRPTQSMPSVPAPPKPEPPEPVFELAPLSARSRPISEPIPAILSPMFAASPSPPRKSVSPPPSQHASLTAAASASKPRPISMPEIELEAPSRRTTTLTASGPLEMREPADRLCNLLRQAKTLAALVLEARPATMSWLVRAAVFRAVHEFRDLLPEAVAHLYRCTGMGRDAAEPALLVLDRVVASHAHLPGEKPLSVDPLVSAAHAKEHLGRYLAEIDRAPLEPALRHYLALGALTELLARAKLPAQTEVRLRDIVSHAQREGPKPGSIELMMTALHRISAG